MRRKDDLVSVVVPCYNVANYVKRCIDSIKDQTYKKIEVLLIDDGSKDETKEIIKSQIRDDERFSYYYKSNGGLSSARNYGMKKAKGKYICFIDSDDYIESNYVEELYTSLIDNNVNISICNIDTIYPNGKHIIHTMSPKIIEMFEFPAAWNKMYKKELFEEYDVVFPEGKWYEDLGTTTKFLLKEKYSIVNKDLYKYIQNDNSIMRTYDDRIFDIYDIIEEVEEFARNQNIYNKKHDSLEFINIFHVLIGTIYRASFHKDYDINMIKSIYNYVFNKYPKWYKNNFLKELSLFYRMYLFLLKIQCFFPVYILLKILKKK